jgi:hypothetical protein
MKIKTKTLNSICRFSAVMLVLCILPSGAFASENKSAFTPAENITDENFADVQSEMLESINDQIAELQSFYTNVSEASNASELQEVLSSNKPAHGCGPEGMNTGPGGMNRGPCGMPGLFGFAQVEDVTDDNYTDVQAEMVDALGNMTEMLNSQLDNSTDDNMTEMLNEQITELEALSSEISAASSADELQDVVFTYVQTQAVESIEMEVEHLEEMASDSENTTNENMSEDLSSRITELNAVIEEINGAESLEDLMEIMASSQGMGVGGPMQHGGCGCPMGPGKMPENSADNSTEA